MDNSKINIPAGKRRLTLRERVKSALAFVGIKGERLAIIKQILHVGVKPFFVNVNHTNYNKRCLIAYITRPFTVAPDKISDSHQNQKQAVEMARVIGTFGYNVDVVNYDDTYALKHIKHKYDLIIDIETLRAPGFWSNNMNDGCKLVIYSTGSSVTFSYAEEQKRLEELYTRRRVKLQPRRGLAKPPKELIIETANAFWHIGNSYNVHTYDYLKLPPVYFIKNTGYRFDWLRKDIIRDKHSFLFFASAGQVHKGLDLLLEIFGREGFGCNLYICSSFMREKDFCEEYRHELFEKPNIFPVGWVDINGQEFRELTEKCAYVLMPSCSEGCAGSILSVMSAGLIPIISRECGIDGEGAVNLPDCKINTIEQYISEYSHKSDAWIKERSEQCVKDIDELYSFESFSRSVHDAVAALQ